MSPKIIRWLAWIGILALTVMTIVPADERPTTGLSHDLEHLGAFGFVGLLVGLSFVIRPPALYALAFAFSATLELLQIPLPSRHARLEDLIVDAVGAWIGIALGLAIAARTTILPRPK